MTWNFNLNKYADVENQITGLTRLSIGNNFYIYHLDFLFEMYYLLTRIKFWNEHYFFHSFYNFF